MVGKRIRITFNCPKCGKRIPADEGLAAKLRHAIYRRGSHVKVVCPLMFLKNSRR